MDNELLRLGRRYDRLRRQVAALAHEYFGAGADRDMARLAEALEVDEDTLYAWMERYPPTRAARRMIPFDTSHEILLERYLERFAQGGFAYRHVPAELADRADHSNYVGSLHAFVDAGKPRPESVLALYGPPHCGKSAIVAERLHRWRNDRAATMRGMIHGLSVEQALAAHIVELGGEARTVAGLTAALAHRLHVEGVLGDEPSPDEGVRRHQIFCALREPARPVVVVVDGLDALRDASPLETIGWLPGRPGPQARIILTTREGPIVEAIRERCGARALLLPVRSRDEHDDHHICLKLLQNLHDGDFPALGDFYEPGHALVDRVGRDPLRATLAWTLAHDANPELVPQTLTGLVEAHLTALERDFPSARRALAAVALARDGLTAAELDALCDGSPEAHAALIEAATGRGLLSRRGDCLIPAHRSLTEPICEAAGIEPTALHADLLSLGRDAPDDERHLWRALRHALGAGDLDDAIALATDADLASRRAEAGMLEAHIAELGRMRRTLPRGEDTPDLTTLDATHRALVAHRDFLSHHPGELGRAVFDLPGPGGALSLRLLGPPRPEPTPNAQPIATLPRSFAGVCFAPRSPTHESSTHATGYLIVWRSHGPIRIFETDGGAEITTIADTDAFSTLAFAEVDGRPLLCADDRCWSLHSGLPVAGQPDDGERFGRSHHAITDDGRHTAWIEPDGVLSLREGAHSGVDPAPFISQYHNLIFSTSGRYLGVDYRRSDGERRLDIIDVDTGRLAGSTVSKGTPRKLTDHRITYQDRDQWDPVDTRTIVDWHSGEVVETEYTRVSIGDGDRLDELDFYLRNHPHKRTLTLRARDGDEILERLPGPTGSWKAAAGRRNDRWMLAVASARGLEWYAIEP